MKIQGFILALAAITMLSSQSIAQEAMSSTYDVKELQKLY